MYNSQTCVTCVHEFFTLWAHTALSHCHNWFPHSPNMAPKQQTWAQLLILRLREVSSLSMGNYIQFLGEVTRVTSTGLPDLGLKSVTEVWRVWHVTHMLWFMTVPPPLGQALRGWKQDKYLQEKEIEHITGEKWLLKKSEGILKKKFWLANINTVIHHPMDQILKWWCQQDSWKICEKCKSFYVDDGGGLKFNSITQWTTQPCMSSTELSLHLSFPKCTHVYMHSTLHHFNPIQVPHRPVSGADTPV